MRGLTVSSLQSLQPPLHPQASAIPWPLTMGALHPSAPASAPHIPTPPPWAVLEHTRQELETLSRTALPPPIGDIKVDLHWPGHPLVAVLGDSQGQRHLGKSTG